MCGAPHTTCVGPSTETAVVVERQTGPVTVIVAAPRTVSEAIEATLPPGQFTTVAKPRRRVKA